MGGAVDSLTNVVKNPGKLLRAKTYSDLFEDKGFQQGLGFTLGGGLGGLAAVAATQSLLKKPELPEVPESLSMPLPNEEMQKMLSRKAQARKLNTGYSSTMLTNKLGGNKNPLGG